MLTRIDTGAGISSLWASSAEETDNGLDVIFFGPGSPFYTGKKQHINSFGRTEIRSSNGQSEERYTIRTLVTIAGKKVRATFTLANRSTQRYPVLIGRNVLRGKFMVDVKLGTSLTAERKRERALEAEYDQNPKE